MRARFSRSQHAGFTLVEVLIALALSLLLITLLFNALHTYASSTKRSQRLIAERQLDESIRHFLRKQLYEIVPLVVRTKKGREVLFAGDATSLSYIGRIPSHRSPGGLHSNVLSISRERGNTVLRFAYERFNADANLDRDAVTRASSDTQRILIEQTEPIAFAYFGVEEAGQEATWRDAWKVTERLPQLIRIRFADDESRTRDLIVPIHASPSSTHIAMNIGARGTQTRFDMQSLDTMRGSTSASDAANFGDGAMR